MSTTGPSGFRISSEIRPHAYDPVTNPELFEGVLARRVIAFFIDMIIIAIPVMLAGAFIWILGLITFGFGWFLFWLWWPAAVIWTLIYHGVTLGSPDTATIGMRVMDLQMRSWHGAPAYFLLGVAHTAVFYLFWVGLPLLAPFILLAGFFNERRRLPHDYLLGIVIINRLAGAQPAAGNQSTS